MKEIKIDHLAYHLKQARKSQYPNPIFFLGAGASRTGNIPLAGEIVKQILTEYPDNPSIKELTDSEKTYAKLMECLHPAERNLLLKKYIDNAKINVTHIYLAQLLNEGFVDYVLTVNFDNLMLRALSLYNIFPSTYDMAILKDLTTSKFKKKSVVYLHGQSHGLWLLNTKDEMEKVKNTVPRIFDAIKDRPWIFIGYSGEDPIFEYIKSLGRIDNGLYWVTYYDNNPGENVQAFLSTTNTNTYIIRGYDSDSFMLKLNNELGLGEPVIVDKPFTALQQMLNGIVDIDDKEHFKGVKERLNISKKQVEEAIQKFEIGKELTINTTENKIDLIKKEIINVVISEKYDEEVISDLEKKALDIKDNHLQALLAGLYSNWGNSLVDEAKTKSSNDSEYLYQQAFKKYKKSIAIRSENHDAFNNWANGLASFARTKTKKEAADLYKQAFEKYQKALNITPKSYNAYFNWGNSLRDFAETKEGEEATSLYAQAFDKYQKAIDINPDCHDAYNNWGHALSLTGKTKTGEDLERLYLQVFDKYQKAIDINPQKYGTYNNWGNELAALAKIKSGEESEALYNKAFDKYQKAAELKPDSSNAYYNWGLTLANKAKQTEGEDSERLQKQAFDKYRKTLSLYPDHDDAYYSWANGLISLTKNKGRKESEQLYKQAFEKYQKALAINPFNLDVYINLGLALVKLAMTKVGEEADLLYKRAFDKYQEAIVIKSDDSDTYINWANGLICQAKNKNGIESDLLHRSAFDKYQKALSINPKNYDAYDNWVSGLTNLAITKVGVEEEKLYALAIDKSREAIEKGGHCYNLACLLAIRGNKDEALIYLNTSLGKNEITIDYVIEDKDWTEFLDDAEFVGIINKYK